MEIPSISVRKSEVFSGCVLYTNNLNRVGGIPPINYKMCVTIYKEKIRKDAPAHIYTRVHYYKRLKSRMQYDNELAGIFTPPFLVALSLVILSSAKVGLARLDKNGNALSGD